MGDVEELRNREKLFRTGLEERIVSLAMLYVEGEPISDWRRWALGLLLSRIAETAYNLGFVEPGEHQTGPARVPMEKVLLDGLAATRKMAERGP